MVEIPICGDVLFILDESVAFICVLGLLEVIGKNLIFSPNGGLMVIYHGRK